MATLSVPPLDQQLSELFLAGKLTKFFACFILALLTAFLLFVAMQALIAEPEVPIVKQPPIKLENFTWEKPSEQIIEQPKPPKLEPPVEKPQTPEPVTSEPVQIAMASPQIDIDPRLTIDNTTNLNPANVINRQATPIVRVEPRYPILALRDGKEGWVQLSFTINELGGVEDVKVIDAQPKQIFNSEAKRALKRWKYQPKVVDGKAQKQINLTIQLDFKMDNAA